MRNISPKEGGKKKEEKKDFQPTEPCFGTLRAIEHLFFFRPNGPQKFRNHSGSVTEVGLLTHLQCFIKPSVAAADHTATPVERLAPSHGYITSICTRPLILVQCDEKEATLDLLKRVLVLIIWRKMWIE